ncbi:Nn.00g052040.m01.CDS01 [Neocucurbitaria sp. VM-36]
MRLKTSSTQVSLIFLISVAFASPDQSKTPNANHVFNAIHSSMRQWGSSLNHNGMSFFLATVPAGTQLYHGTGEQDAIEGMQWLAFEPEHALIFARPRRGPPPHEGDGPLPSEGPEADHKLRPAPHHDDEFGPKPKRPFDPEHHRPMPPPPPPPPHHPHDVPPHHENSPPSPPPEDRPEPPSHHEPRPPGHHEPRPPGRHDPSPPPPPAHRGGKRNSQQPLGFQNPKQDRDRGYLHTYVPKHPLRLLYIDGLSAGKTSNGTLDTQDMLILNLTDTGGPMGGEFDRAIGMCNLTSSLWEGKVDGILRMEGGFEIILCDFEKHLERTDIITVTDDEKHGEPGLLGGWPYLKALTSRYHGIGGERVTIDYEHFVSVFGYPDVDGLFTNDVQSDYAMPRLQNVKDSDLVRIRGDVTKMILQKDWDEETRTINWQVVADMVVQRYAESLHYLHTNQQIREDKDALATYLTGILRPFIDFTARDAVLETQRCVSQAVPPLPSPPRPVASLAHGTLHAVTHHICDTLLTSLSIASSSTPHSSFTSVYAAHAFELIDDLVDYLRWTTWKQCGTCQDEEVCFIPIWPMGSHEDHAKPRCLKEQAARERMGYWGFRGGPPREGKPPKEGEPRRKGKKEMRRW